ncbi:hypothetical protein C943_02136 [Mariniradius saccharolyticus AK6]|uniref:Uncharacterized protein n=1 Tax=Mariniradius saccharolyticus AK6 TaxID=1239962 RepID=M7Y2P0_9BACT|nr:hypothetical protein [Mariniradius saccharolyticus]EMS31481.1 hypothetical protein C943_02136 [Mariniradius saccharolyticus AK6]
MKFFYLSSESTATGEFEIHERNCPKIPSLAERSYLGPFVTSAEALKQARRFKPKAVLCSHCHELIHIAPIEATNVEDNNS